MLLDIPQDESGKKYIGGYIYWDAGTAIWCSIDFQD
jgi:hypothetical protein